ncbi:MAG: hypothetical protein WCV88_04670, partial [Patescibacteria group bacterium]
MASIDSKYLSAFSVALGIVYNDRSSINFTAFGMAFEIFKAIIEAVFRAGGGDNDLMMVVKRSELADKIAALIMMESGKSRPTPVIDGLTVFEIEVDGDDPRWQRIEASKYAYCNE